MARQTVGRTIIVDGRIPTRFIVLVVALCILPFVLNLLGVDFAAQEHSMDIADVLPGPANGVTHNTFFTLRGASIHTMLEWSAVMIAVAVTIAAFTQYLTGSNVALPVVGLAFLMAGSMDAFHALAVDHLLGAIADSRNFEPLTWALSRSCNALILLLGIGITLSRQRQGKVVLGMRTVLLTGMVFLASAFVIVYLLAGVKYLPQTTFPDALIVRPYDALALVLFVFSGLSVYPRFYKRNPNLFTQALIISAVPQVAAQLHMSFFSTVMFDNDFNIAHFLKILAYAVPVSGLGLEYFRAYHQSVYLQKKLMESSGKLFDSEEHMRVILNGVADGIVIIDTQGIIKELNPAVLTIFGYEEQDLLGENVRKLMPEPHQSAHDGYLEAYRTTGVAKVIGKRLEVSGLRSDGSVFPMDLVVDKMTIHGETSYSGLIRDISERKAAETAKSEFISTVSHELRTPLTSIRGALGLVLGGASGQLPDAATKMLEVANRNSERLIIMINDLLDLEKLQAGKIKFEFEALDLVHLVEQSLEANQGYATGHDIVLQTLPGLPLATVNADSYRIQQVLANLISNAVKFSPAGEHVEISVCHNEDGGIRTTVRDHGQGIAEEFKSRIFQRFSQADSSDERQKGGTGLGLSISKVIIEEHGGSIDFRAAEGGGTEFFFDLPEVSAQAAGPAAASTQADSSVLICEDNADVAMVLSGILEKEGLKCDVAANAAQAKQLLFSKDYLLLLLDLGLPDQNGIDLIGELRNDSRTTELPIIVVSASAEEGRESFGGRAAEVVDWIPKPVDEERLRKALKQVFDSAGSARVLHVEDDLDVIQVVRHLVGDSADYDYATRLADAAGKLNDTEYDLVIIDIQLPDGSGLELLPVLKNRCPVIIFSGQDADRDIKDQVAAYFTKGTTSNEELSAAIRRIRKSMKIGKIRDPHMS